MPGRPRVRPDRHGEAGLTLIELVISMAIIGVALAGTLGVMRRTIAGSADPVLSEQALAVGEAYLEEVLAKPFYDPDLGPPVCPPREVSRTLWDNVCDYDTLDDAGARDQSDSAVPGLGNYRVRVAVDTTANLGALTGSTVVVRVDVRVTHTSQVDQTLSGYRTRF